jgi:hypothetical protein
MPLTTYTAGEVLTAASLNANFTFAAANPVSKIAQVVSTAKTDTFSSSTVAFTDITGFSVSITPTSATSKILVLASYSVGISGDILVLTRLMRNSTAISIGDTAGSRTPTSNVLYAIDGGTFVGGQLTGASINFLDSPATTSATTYKIQMYVNSGTGYINRNNGDANGANTARTASSITVMEILA